MFCKSNTLIPGLSQEPPLQLLHALIHLAYSSIIERFPIFPAAQMGGHLSFQECTTDCLRAGV